MIKNFKNIKYEILVVLFFILTRLPALGNDGFNTDVWRWKARTYDFGNGFFTLKFDQTLQTYHPGVTLMWLGGFGIKFYNLYSDIVNHSDPALNSMVTVFQLDLWQKIFIVSGQAVAFGFAFYVLRKLFGLKYAIVTFILLNFEPFYLALTRVIHLEGLESTFMLVSILWFYYYLADKKLIRRAVISGIFAGLAILTKTSALFLLPFIGLASFLFFFREEKHFFKAVKLSVRPFLLWLFALVATFFLLWPALWVKPGEVFKTLYSGIVDIGIEGDHEQLYFGKLVTNPGPSFYFVVLGFRSSIYLLVGFIGVLFIRKKLPTYYKNFLDYLLVFIFFYFIQLTLPTKKLDRYILPEQLVMMLTSSIFFVWLFEKLKFGKIKILIALIPVLLTAIYLHPDYLSYYNPAFGGLKTGINVLEPKWLIGVDPLIDYFKNVQKRDGYIISTDSSFEELVYKGYGKEVLQVVTVGFREKNYSQVWPFFRKFGAWAVIRNLTPFANKTRYFVYPVWDDDSKLEDRYVIKYIGDVKLRGVPVYKVYIREAKNLIE
ncbi:glycosyltransferase family 39 protein [Patescibacteria group bacterium]|nr:glycosyltransferase family 39 protein [Patescibacteria group bacterium]MBU1953039.1 glycosyltransferase family 39 protein [Patescibacteria group bacterium]